MTFFRFLDWLLDRLVGPFVAVLGLFIALAFAAGITLRSLGISLFGMEELVLFAVVWFYMLGAVLASKDRAHLQADFIPVMVKSEALALTIRIVATVISMLMAGLFMLWSHELLQWAFSRRQSTPVFSLPIYIAQASLFIAAVFMTLYLVRDLVSDIKALCRRRQDKNTRV
ncbi:TRAP transporter small permease subunit [Halomonas sp. MCCC 1A11036]|uniref:TRAP transporter small permease protein n=1 Tax=Billgrantia zhangzhouensis TaxID=2733481 RepID=A0ABS9AJE5_9GAMM|nr:TRAP transporter small permease subunit [Halomonas zhangzhouensis]MCE8021872.1 TRAP transporter small permease subunit [Halomonas zhangzhouensis]